MSKTPNKSWTLKGVTPEIIVLARSAARKQGMFLGAWVSQAIKAAAEEKVASTVETPALLSRIDELGSNVLAEVQKLIEQGKATEQELTLLRRAFLPLLPKE